MIQRNVTNLQRWSKDAFEEISDVAKSVSRIALLRRESHCGFDEQLTTGL